MLENGKLPADMLAPTVAGGRLAEDAALSVGRMGLAFYKEFGAPMLATDTYRTYEQQVVLREEKGVWAAIPGTSNHGWGRAVDWSSSINRDSSPEHRWMELNGPKYGWINPWWAVDNDPRNGQYEPWHWEYVATIDRMKGAPGVLFPQPGQIGYGQDGEDVLAVQRMLKDIGYREIMTDGDYGMGTAARVVSFQGRHGLTQDGVVGTVTLEALTDAVQAEEDNEMPTAQEIAKAVWEHKTRVPSNLQKYLGESATQRQILAAIALRVERADLTDNEIIAELNKLNEA